MPEQIKNTANGKLKIKGPANGTLVVSFSGERMTSNPGGEIRPGLTPDELKQKSTLVLLCIQDNDSCHTKHLQLIVEKALHDYHATSFLVADELHWHNLINIDTRADQTNELKAQAIAMGDAYLKTNLSYFLNAIKNVYPGFEIDDLLKSKIGELEQSTGPNPKIISEIIFKLNQDISRLRGAPFEIIRWHEFINDPAHNFATKQNEITALFNIPDSKLNTDLQSSVDAFVNSHKQDVKGAELLFLKDRSRNYLLEESAAIPYIAALRQFNFIIYPGNIPTSFRTSKDYFIVRKDRNNTNSLLIQVDDPDMLANWVKAAFKRKHLTTTEALQRCQRIDSLYSTDSSDSTASNTPDLSSSEGNSPSGSLKPEQNMKKFLSADSKDHGQKYLSTNRFTLFNNPTTLQLPASQNSEDRNDSVSSPNTTKSLREWSADKKRSVMTALLREADQADLKIFMLNAVILLQDVESRSAQKEIRGDFTWNK